MKKKNEVHSQSFKIPKHYQYSIATELFCVVHAFVVALWCAWFYLFIYFKSMVLETTTLFQKIYTASWKADTEFLPGLI